MEIVALALLGPLAIAVRRFWLPTGATLAAITTIAALLLAATLKGPRTDASIVYAAHLLVALAAAIWVAVAAVPRARAEGRWRSEAAFVGLLLFAALLAHLNFLSFHGFRRWVHQHDVAHYYLGSKYLPELGYGRLYVAALRAEAQSHGGYFRAASGRDLATGELRPVPYLLEGSAAVEARFAPGRWREFRLDVDRFRELNPEYDRFLRDYGFNPTPVWALIGGSLANLVPAGSARGILLLTLLDTALLLALGATAAKAFGARAAAIAAILFCVVAGASFDWVGGAFLRYLWFVATGLSICLLRLGRPGAAGAALGLAAALRIFPAVLVIAFAIRWCRRLVVEKRAGGTDFRFLSGFLCAVTGLVAATLLGTGGSERWLEFIANLKLLASQAAGNDIGFAALMRSSGLGETGLGAAVGIVLLVLVGIVIARAATRVDASVALLLGVPLIFFAVPLSSYYWSLLSLVPLVLADRRPPLVALFGLESVSWFVQLVSGNLAATISVRNSLLAALLLALPLILLRIPTPTLRAAPEEATDA